MKSYVFRVVVEEDTTASGQEAYHAYCPALEGCRTWGRTYDEALANVREAKIDTLTSQYELRGFTEALVARVEEAYWNYCLDQRQIEIFQQSLKIAEQQLHEGGF